jgi:hypothetical protein
MRVPKPVKSNNRDDWGREARGEEWAVTAGRGAMSALERWLYPVFMLDACSRRVRE